MGEHLTTAKDRFGAGQPSITAGLTQGVRVPPLQPSTISTTDHTYAYANHNRWVVDCPFCSSAQLTTPPGDLSAGSYFFCVECFNAAAESKWIEVWWPKDYTEIEAVLLERVDPKTRNAKVGETAVKLRSETEVMVEVLQPTDPLDKLKKKVL